MLNHVISDTCNVDQLIAYRLSRIVLLKRYDRISTSQPTFSCCIMQETSQNEDCGDGGNTEAQKIHALEVALMDTNKVSDIYTQLASDRFNIRQALLLNNRLCYRKSKHWKPLLTTRRRWAQRCFVVSCCQFLSRQVLFIYLDHSFASQVLERLEQHIKHWEFKIISQRAGSEIPVLLYILIISFNHKNQW